MVVLAIIGLLGALIGPRLFERLEGSKVVTAQTQVRMLKTALDTMRLDIGRYPSAEEGLDLLVRAPTDPQLRLRWHGPYLEGEVPLGPVGKPLSIRPHGPRPECDHLVQLTARQETGRRCGRLPARGLTAASRLIELVVALAVVGLILSVTLPRVAGWLDRFGFSARQQRCEEALAGMAETSATIAGRTIYLRLPTRARKTRTARRSSCPRGWTLTVEPPIVFRYDGVLHRRDSAHELPGRRRSYRLAPPFCRPQPL